MNPAHRATVNASKGLARYGFSMHTRDAVYQTSGGVLEPVAIMHNVIFFIPSVEPTLFEISGKRREHLEAPGLHSLLQAGDAGLKGIVAWAQIKSQLAIHLNQLLPIRLK